MIGGKDEIPEWKIARRTGLHPIAEAVLAETEIELGGILTAYRSRNFDVGLATEVLGGLKQIRRRLTAKYKPWLAVYCLDVPLSGKQTKSWKTATVRFSASQLKLLFQTSTCGAVWVRWIKLTKPTTNIVWMGDGELPSTARSTRDDMPYTGLRLCAAAYKSHATKT